MLSIQQQLEAYSAICSDESQKSMAREILSFVQTAAHPFDRTQLDGHITGSALVVNKDYSKVLLTHHKKFN